MNSYASIALLEYILSSQQICESKILNVHQNRHSRNINPVKKEPLR